MDFPLAHKHEKVGDNRQHQTNLKESSQKSSHMVGVSTSVVNTGTLPTLTFGSYECDIWRITNNYDGTIRVHAEVSH